MKPVHLLKMSYLYHCKVSNLTNWEYKFISAVYESEQIRNRVSPKQLDKIDEIYNKIRKGIKRFHQSYKERHAIDYDNPHDIYEMQAMYNEVHDFDRD